MIHKPFVIAIDGMAGAGKRTLSQQLAERYNFAYLDTGLIYRAVAALIMAEGADLRDVEACLRICEKFSPVDLQREGLRSEEVGQAASIIASYPGIRQKLLDFQRNFANTPPYGEGAILDGRDIGTVVWPQAEVKLFLTVDLQTAAIRRFKELQSLGIPSIYDSVLQEIQARDQRDQQRETAPMRPADDAYVVDTTNLSVGEVLAIAIGIIDRKLKVQGTAASQSAVI